MRFSFAPYEADRLRIFPIVALLLLNAAALLGQNYAVAAAEKEAAIVSRSATGRDVPDFSDLGGAVVHPVLGELHTALEASPEAFKAARAKFAKADSAKGTASEYVDFLLLKAGRTVPGPGPSYSASKAGKRNSRAWVEPVALEFSEESDSRDSRPEEKVALTKPSEEESHVQLRITGVLDLGADADLARRQLTGPCQAVDVQIQGRGVYAWVPSGMVPCLATVQGVSSWSPSLISRKAAKPPPVHSQGDIAMRTNAVRAAWNVTGLGTKVGILSDSFDTCGTEVYPSQVAGELPWDVEILSDVPHCLGIDEGRGMAEIVHDVAPGAAIAFHTAAGTLDFANGIRQLARAGCDVIVDDIGFQDEPTFFDGTIAMAVNEVTRAGVSYATAAGNDQDRSYESHFVRSGVNITMNGVEYELHDFDPSNATQTYQRVRAQYGFSNCMMLQWDQPWATQGPWALGPGAATAPGAISDLAMFIKVGNQWFTSRTHHLGGDAIDLVCFYQFTGEYEIYIGLHAGPPPANIKTMLTFAPSSMTMDVDFDTKNSTTLGHVSAALAVSVGAAYYGDTPVFNPTLSVPLLIDYSSKGGTRITFDDEGNYIGPEGVIRRNPTVVGPTGADTSFFYPGDDYEGNGHPNFGGTSASAPHVAGLIALYISAVKPVMPRPSPPDVISLLMATAQDMDVPGFDFNTGAGFADGYALFEAALLALRDRSVQALQSFKRGLGVAAAAGALGNWVEGTDPCNGWTGVTCAPQPFNAVVGLRLAGQGLSGTLSPSLGNLTGLRVLDLGGNALSGTIPEELGSLAYATVIDLADNQLSGLLPVSLDGLRQLEGLDLRNNAALSGCMPVGIAAVTGFSGTSIHGVCGDTLEYPIWVDHFPFAFSSNASLFSHDIPVDACGADGAQVAGPDVAFIFKAERDGLLHVSLCGSSADTYLSIWLARDGVPESALACSDDSPLCQGPQGTLEVTVAVNETYYIAVSGKAAGEAGTFDVIIQAFPFLAPDIAAAERSALLAFRAALAPFVLPTVGAPPPLLASWDGPDTCAFDGVYCAGGHVEALVLPPLWLEGALDGPAQQLLLVLVNLRVLDLSRNPSLSACKLGILRDVVKLASADNNLGMCGDTAEVAITIRSLPFDYMDHTGDGFAEDGPGEEFCYGLAGPDVFFSFTPDASGVYTFSLCPEQASAYETDYDSMLALYAEGSAHGSCSDDACSFFSKITAVLTAGVKYYIVVSGFRSDTGVFHLRVRTSDVSMAHVNETHSLLLDIKAELTDGATLLADWSTDDYNYCDWPRVWCGLDGALEVRQIDFRFMGATGHIPPSIGRLPSLTYIGLSYNSFSGSIPAELAGPVPESEDTRGSVLLSVMLNQELTGCVPDEIAFRKNAMGNVLFLVNARRTKVGGPCRYADIPPTVHCPADLLLDNVPTFAAFLPGQLQASITADDETAYNVVNEGVHVTCTPPLWAPFFEGTTPVVCRAVDADHNEDNCTFEVTVTAAIEDLYTLTPPSYLGTVVVCVPGVDASSFTPLVLTTFATELSASSPLLASNVFRVEFENSTSCGGRTRALLQATGVQLTLVFGVGSLAELKAIVAWFNDPSAATVLGLMFADILGVPVGPPSVSVTVGGYACCLPPSPDPVCLADGAIASSAQCVEIGHRLLPAVTQDAIWLGASGQCADCAALWDRPGARSDPHFVTADGTHFDWMGEGDRSFCIISDKAVHVNAHLFAGTDGRRKGTWMDQIAVIHGGDHVVVSTGANTGFPGLHGSISINGRRDMNVGSSASAVVAEGFTVRRKKTRTWVTVEGLLDLEVEVVRASTWEAGRGPARDFLNFRVRGLNATEGVHGVLGQTFRPAAQGATKGVLKGLVEGTDPDYMTSGLLAPDCLFTQFLA